MKNTNSPKIEQFTNAYCYPLPHKPLLLDQLDEHSLVNNYGSLQNHPTQIPKRVTRFTEELPPKFEGKRMSLPKKYI